jgi:hypothetical protein
MWQKEPPKHLISSIHVMETVRRKFSHNEENYGGGEGHNCDRRDEDAVSELLNLQKLHTYIKITVWAKCK